MKKSQLACTIISALSLSACGGGSGDTTSDNSPAATPAPIVTPVAPSINSSTSVGIVGTPYTVTYDVGTSTSCTLDSYTVTGSGTETFTPTEAGIVSTLLACDEQVVTAQVNIIPEIVTIADPVFADALARMGFTVTNNTMDAEDVLDVTQICIEGRQGVYSEIPDEHNTFVLQNTDHPMYPGTCTYTYDSVYITDLSGLEYFVNLTKLSLDYQAFDSIDVSGMTNIEFLGVSAVPITEIDLSQNTALKHFVLDLTGLETVDTSTLALLEVAEVKNMDDLDNYKDLPVTLGNGTVVHGVTHLDFSNNPLLERAYLFGNPITTMDDTGLNNPASKASLNELWIMNTGIVHADFSEFTNLTWLMLYNSQDLLTLDVSGLVMNRFYTEQCPLLSAIVTHDLTLYTNMNVTGGGGWIDDHHYFVLAD